MSDTNGGVAPLNRALQVAGWVFCLTLLSGIAALLVQRFDAMEQRLGYLERQGYEHATVLAERKGRVAAFDAMLGEHQGLLRRVQVLEYQIEQWREVLAPRKRQPMPNDDAN